MDMEEISFFIPENDLHEAQSFLSKSQEIELINPRSYALDAVTKYRKLISWWIFVRSTPRIMVYDFKFLFHCVKSCKLPFFSENIESLGSIISTFIENYEILKKELISFSEKVEDFLECAVHFDPETSDEYFQMHNDVVMFGCDILQYFVDCKECFDDYIDLRNELAEPFLL
ncbi:hypothetical protein CDAR_305351 [Caerostris darwini]|uniref:Uncharacterized protein n=1 Tax=Caerostris darwini TaxID=1538125 RepID=A0AAV4MDV3_9ARAC|nr:hypothetical protein CDAR_305351 [Caerostris darwini]